MESIINLENLQDVKDVIMGNRLLSVLLTCLVTLTGCASKESLPDETEPDSPSEDFGQYVSGTLPYRMKKTAADNGSKPILVMYLHGGSSKGNDNETQMKESAVSVIAGYLADNSIPSIFIVPQCPPSGSWGAKMNEPLAKLIGEYEAFCESINATGGSANCTIVPASEQWSHQTTCEQSYTTERLRWLFGK